MSDAAAATVVPTATRGRPKASKARKSKSSAAHPKYVEMSVSAINELKEKNGLSRQAILKYIMNNYDVGKDPKTVNTHLKMALKRGVASGVLKHAKGQGASGSFRISDKVGPVMRKPRRKSLKRKAPVVEKVVQIEKVKITKKKTPKKKKAAAVVAVKTPQKTVVAKKKVGKGKKAKSPKRAVAKKPVAKPKKMKAAKSKKTKK